MKTTKLLTYAIFVLFLGFAISSCSGDDGATGPAGADGQDGNANVIYSEWITPSWSAGILEGIQVIEADIISSEITQDVLNSAVIFVYMKNHNYDIWQLPFSTPLTTDVVLNIDFYIKLNGIHLYHYSETHPETLPPTPNAEIKFRYIIIQGNIPGKSNNNPQQAIYTELKNACIDINDYYDVCDYYGIDSE